MLKDKSKSVFKGMIRIGKDARNSSAYLAGHAILLSPDAKSDAIPGLEILTNEVKATHSASVAQIDQEQIFYMMTRGLSEDEAKKFIVLGFLEPAISRIHSRIQGHDQRISWKPNGMAQRVWSRRRSMRSSLKRKQTNNRNNHVTSSRGITSTVEYETE